MRVSILNFAACAWESSGRPGVAFSVSAGDSYSEEAPHTDNLSMSPMRIPQVPRAISNIGVLHSVTLECWVLRGVPQRRMY